MFGEVCTMDVRWSKFVLMGVITLATACFEEAEEDPTGAGADTDSSDNSFTVSSPDDVVWLGVYDRPNLSNAPTGEVGSGYVAYTLSGVGAGQAKRRAAISRTGHSQWNQFRQDIASHVLPSLLEDTVS